MNPASEGTVRVFNAETGEEIQNVYAVAKDGTWVDVYVPSLTPDSDGVIRGDISGDWKIVRRNVRVRTDGAPTL